MTDVEALIATVREGLDWGLGLRHKTRKERRIGENNYWDVDVHEPKGCKRCEVDAALDSLAAELERLIHQRDVALTALREIQATPRLIDTHYLARRCLAEIEGDNPPPRK